MYVRWLSYTFKILYGLSILFLIILFVKYGYILNANCTVYCMEEDELQELLNIPYVQTKEEAEAFGKYYKEFLEYQK